MSNNPTFSPKIWADAILADLSESMMSPTMWLIRLEAHEKLFEELQPLALLADIEMLHQILPEKRRSYFIFHGRGDKHFTVTEVSNAEEIKALLAKLANPF